MSVRYKYSGLTPELYQRLVDEHAALRKTHKKGSYKQFFQDVKQCDELQARIIYQALNAAVVERARISPATVDRLEGIISDSTTFKIICLLITQEEKPLNRFWRKPTQDCQRGCLNDSKKKWKNYAKNTLTI